MHNPSATHSLLCLQSFETFSTQATPSSETQAPFTASCVYGSLITVDEGNGMHITLRNADLFVGAA